MKAAGDDRLTGTHYDWLRNRAAMGPRDRREFDVLRKSELKTARAWALKETAMALYGYIYERPARKHFRWWLNWALRSRLKPMIEVARMLKRRFAFRNNQNFIHAIYFPAAASTWRRYPLDTPGTP